MWAGADAGLTFLAIGTLIDLTSHQLLPRNLVQVINVM